MGRQLEISKQTKIAEMLAAGYKKKEIAKATGAGEDTVRKYKREYERDEKAFVEKIRNREKEAAVAARINAGCSLKNIVAHTKASPDYVMDKAQQMAAEEEPDVKKQLEFWLKTHWRWKNMRAFRRRVNPKTGLRIVYIGEKGSIRTPYRPDGVWR